MTRRLAPSLVSALIFILAITGCGGDGDDPPVTPPELPVETGLLVPEDYPTIADAVAAARADGSSREVSLAAGEYTVDLSLDWSVTLRRRSGLLGEVRLIDSRLTVRAGSEDTVRLRGLVFVGGDTALAVPGDAVVVVDSCRIRNAVLGIQHTGAGALALDTVEFVDCLGSGAIHVADAASLTLVDCTFRDCQSDEAGVVRVAGTTPLIWRGGRLDGCASDQTVVSVEDAAGGAMDGVIVTFCTPYTVRHRGDLLTLTDCWFEMQSGTSLGVGSGSRAEVSGCHFRQAVWPVMDVGGEVAVSACVVFDGLGHGPALLLGDGGRLTADAITVHQGAGPLLSLGAGATADLTACLVTQLAVPMAVGDTSALAMTACDLWVSGASAWSGLEAVRDAGEGNVEVDPLYCDGASGDLRLQDGTPAAGMGALGVGCR